MNFIRMLFSTFLQSFTNIFFIGLVLIIYWNIKKRAYAEESWLGFIRYRVSDQLLEQIFYGMLFGLVASFIIVILGITIEYRTILIIWPLAILLTLFNQRYMCFSYAAGIISLISLIFGWPRMDVSAIIALVGVLHLVESALIFFGGYKSSLPVYVEESRFKPAGAYIMQKMWPIPLVILTIPDASAQLSGAGVSMPQWWPIFQSQGMEGVLAILPIAAILGYADIAITQTPKDRAKKSGLWLAIYSIIVLVLGTISSRVYWVKYLAAIATPILHELTILLGKKEQMEGSYLFGIPWKGVRVLEVYPDQIGETMGLDQGDIILSINGQSVNSIRAIDNILSERPNYIWLDVKRGEEIIILEGQDFQNGISDLGTMFVPRQTGKYFLFEEQKGIIPRLWNDSIRRDRSDND